MTNTEAWNRTLAVMCHCYADVIGNRPCDNGCICDKCHTKEVEEFYKKLKEVRK